MGTKEMAIVLEAVKTLDHGKGEVAEVPDEGQGDAHEEKLPPSLRVREDGEDDILGVGGARQGAVLHDKTDITKSVTSTTTRNTL